MSGYNLTIYRASENSPIETADSEAFGIQLPLLKYVDDFRPKNTLPRIGSLFTGLTPKEASQWGDNLWTIEAIIPYEFSNAYDITKWTRIADYWLSRASSKSNYDQEILNELITDYWTSAVSVNKLISQLEWDEDIGRYELLISPEWVQNFKPFEGKVINEDGYIPIS